MRHARGKAFIFLRAATVGFAIVIGFVAIRAHAPVQEDFAPARTPVRWPPAPSTKGLPAAPDVEIVMYQAERPEFDPSCIDEGEYTTLLQGIRDAL
jgi:hypothetical protein